jgi:hypothetical protein
VGWGGSDDECGSGAEEVMAGGEKQAVRLSFRLRTQRRAFDRRGREEKAAKVAKGTAICA